MIRILSFTHIRCAVAVVEYLADLNGVSCRSILLRCRRNRSHHLCEARLFEQIVRKARPCVQIVLFRNSSNVYNAALGADILRHRRGNVIGCKRRGQRASTSTRMGRPRIRPHNNNVVLCLQFERQQPTFVAQQNSAFQRLVQSCLVRLWIHR